MQKQDFLNLRLCKSGPKLWKTSVMQPLNSVGSLRVQGTFLSTAKHLARRTYRPVEALDLRRLDLGVGVTEPDLDPLTLQQAQPGRTLVLAVLRRPEA